MVCLPLYVWIMFWAVCICLCCLRCHAAWIVLEHLVQLWTTPMFPLAKPSWSVSSRLVNGEASLAKNQPLLQRGGWWSSWRWLRWHESDMGPGAKCSAVQHHDCDSSRFNKDVTAGGMSWFMFFCAPIVSLPLLCGWFSWFLHLQKCIRSPQRFLMPFPENGKNYDGNYLAMHWPCTGHALAMQRNLARPQRREVPEYPEPEEARCTDRRVGWLGCLMHLMPNDVCSLLMCLVCSSYSLHVVPDLKASAWINPGELLQHVQSISHDWKNWEATWIMPHAISCNTSCSSMVLYFKIEPT